MSMEPYDARLRRLAQHAIDTFELDLHGLTVLTEAATGAYVVTPLLAALAGARVIAVARDSTYGRATEVAIRTTTLAHRWGVEVEIRARTLDEFALADVVTNLGGVRPINAEAIDRLRETAAIALMYEPWEVRSEDVDLSAAHSRDISVAGTDESDDRLRTFDYVGVLAAKLVFELGLELLGTRVVTLGDGRFLEACTRGLTSAGADVRRLIVGEADHDAVLTAVTEADALVVCAHASLPLIGPAGLVRARELRAAAPWLGIAHIIGAVDEAELRAAGLPFRPHLLARPGYMSVTTAHVGPRPVVNLHAAGLRVGAVLARARLNGLSSAEAMERAMRDAPGMPA